MDEILLRQNEDGVLIGLTVITVIAIVIVIKALKNTK
jgi:hypothetical protein